MSRSYIPMKDADLAGSASAFSDYIANNYMALGLAQSEATTFGAAVSAFTDALALCTSPATKTKAAVAAKDGCKAALLAVYRQIAQFIKSNQGISNDIKTALGLTIDDTKPTPIPAPTTQPLLNLIGSTPLLQTLRVSDASTPDKRAKPPGAIGLVLFKYVGTTEPASPELADYVGQFGMSTIEVPQDPADKGKTAWYYARWVTRRGLLGPWSAGVSMVIA